MSRLPKPAASNPAPLAFRLHYVGRRVGEAMDRALEGAALTVGQAKFLRHIVDQPEGIMPIEIAQRAGCSRANATQMLSRLEAAGLVRRHENPDDARSAPVCATPAGRRALGEALALIEGFERQLRSELGKAQAVQLWQILELLEATETV